MPVQYQLAEGTPGVTLNEVAHLMIPGRYRSADGMGLSDLTIERVDTAATFFLDNELASREGIVVGSGYKNPGDHVGEPWKDELGEEFEGIPEAYSMCFRLVGQWGISRANVKVDPYSVDSVTNFANTQSHYPDERPVGIFAQEQHLDRILSIIAPKTMRRDYVGIVVPELAGQPDKDGLLARLVSRWVARGITPATPNASEIAEARVQKIWHRINQVKSLKTLPNFSSKSNRMS